MKLNTWTKLLWISSISLAAHPLQAADQHADTVLVSNHVVTMASRAPKAGAPMAIAITGERIIGLAPPAEAGRWTGPDTQTIIFEDQAILPGFIDAHGHVSFSALATNLANVASPPVGPVTDMQDLQQTLKAFISSRDIADGEWVVGMGYDDSLIAEQRHPNRDDLDQVSTRHPVLLIHVSGHLVAGNSRALARGGISAETPDPAGGVIRRRPNSLEPDGVLEETATYALRKYMTAPDTDPIDSLTRALQDYASYGITTVQDGAAGPDVMSLLEQANAADKLLLDVIAYPVGQVDAISMIDRYNWGAYNKRLKVAGVKLILDGSPQGKTAYLSKPYHVPPPGSAEDYAGYPTITPAHTAELVATYLQHEIPVIAHANGDAAAAMLIDAVAQARPGHDHRTVMIHAQTVREDQLTQMKMLGMIPSYFSAHTFFWGDWHRDSVLGATRSASISPTASTAQRGMVFTVHNDAPVVPPDMLRLLWATTNRLTRSGQVLGPAQRVSIHDGLRAMTIYAAFQQFEEQHKGSIEVGKLADLVVLSADPLKTEPADLLSLEVKATYARGRRVF
ncbi:MAG: amidohydrolase [bacterium]